MKVTAISMVRDEADVIASTVRNLAAQVDELIVADNGSTDGTREILDELAGSLPLIVIDDPDPAYMQSAKMTRLAHIAGERGAEWIVPFDADELWYCTGVPLGDALGGIGTGMMVATAQLFDHVATGFDDAAEADPVRRLRWRRVEPLPLPKVACRFHDGLRIHMGNHGCDYGGVLPASTPLLTIRHFPYRSPEQFVRKVRNGSAAYRATGTLLPADAGAHWRQWGDILDAHGPEAVLDIFRAWYYRTDPTVPVEMAGETLPPLLHDPAPVMS